jgi:hypothetical protein
MRTRISVTEELDDFCPLTIWKIIAARLLAIVPWLLLCVSVAAFFMLGSKWTKNAENNLVTISIMSFMIAAIIIFAPGRRSLTKEVKDRRNRNTDGYWMFYTVNPAGDQEKAIGPLTLAARDTVLRERTDDDWLYFMVSFKPDEDGMIFNGNKHPRKDEIQPELAWWKVRPIVLASYHSDLPKVRLALVDKNGAVSLPLSIQVAARFIRSTPIGSMGN